MLAAHGAQSVDARPPVGTAAPAVAITGHLPHTTTHVDSILVTVGTSHNEHGGRQRKQGCLHNKSMVTPSLLAQAALQGPRHCALHYSVMISSAPGDLTAALLIASRQLSSAAHHMGRPKQYVDHEDPLSDIPASSPTIQCSDAFRRCWGGKDPQRPVLYSTLAA
jgi:hypothetical protein